MAPDADSDLDVEMDLAGVVLGQLPTELERFATVDELNASIEILAHDFPELVTVRRIGTSRNGEPLWVATIGSGSRDALVVGGPHPNEPVGGLTVRELSRILCVDDDLRERLGLRWHLVPCIDPDGARLNESWYDRPGDRDAYGRGFYRPAMDEQVEWTFPHLEQPGYFDRVLPETQALIRLIDETRPILQCSLHNGEYGGAFHYLSTPDTTTGQDEPGAEAPTGERLARQLSAVPGRCGLPLHNAAWEVPDSAVLAPAVFRMPTAYETAAMHGGDGRFGASSGDYAARYGTVTVATEVPYWQDVRAADLRECGETFAAVVGSALPSIESATDAIRPLLGELRLDTPFRRSLQDLLNTCHTMTNGWRRVVDHPMAARPATEAERCSFEVLPHILRLRLAGTLLRSLHAELATGNTRPRHDLATAEATYQKWRADADTALPGTPIPLRNLVATQALSALTAAATLQQTSPRQSPYAT